MRCASCPRRIAPAMRALPLNVCSVRRSCAAAACRRRARRQARSSSPACGNSSAASSRKIGSTCGSTSSRMSASGSSSIERQHDSEPSISGRRVIAVRRQTVDRAAPLGIDAAQVRSATPDRSGSGEHRHRRAFRIGAACHFDAPARDGSFDASARRPLAQHRLGGFGRSIGDGAVVRSTPGSGPPLRSIRHGAGAARLRDRRRRDGLFIESRRERCASASPASAAASRRSSSNSPWTIALASSTSWCGERLLRLDAADEQRQSGDRAREHGVAPCPAAARRAARARSASARAPSRSPRPAGSRRCGECRTACGWRGPSRPRNGLRIELQDRNSCSSAARCWSASSHKIVHSERDSVTSPT